MRPRDKACTTHSIIIDFFWAQDLDYQIIRHVKGSGHCDNTLQVCYKSYP